MENEEQEETNSGEQAEGSSAHRPRTGADEEAASEDDTNSFRTVNVFLGFKQCRRNSEQWRSQVKTTDEPQRRWDKRHTAVAMPRQQ